MKNKHIKRIDNNNKIIRPYKVRYKQLNVLGKPWDCIKKAFASSRKATKALSKAFEAFNEVERSKKNIFKN